MDSLFTMEPSLAGYRLQYMEIYNWGTFDSEIFRISPGGNTSLLCGGNGSGKTTYVDALLTLLVPIGKYRFYNRSSGADKKRDRTEESYVMGAFAEQQVEGKLEAQTLYLREDKQTTYSILVACFFNPEKDPITLFQTRWFYNGELKRAYGISFAELTIEKDFVPFDPKGEWKRGLKKKYNSNQDMSYHGRNVIEFFDTAKNYAGKLVRYFGMRSDKALSLFSQTVSIKVLGNLNDFIRQHMLEEQASFDEFMKLKENYKTLLHAQNQIDKAALQLKKLEPIKEESSKYDEIKAAILENNELKKAIPIYFNFKKHEFLQDEIFKEEKRLDEVSRNILHTEKEITDHQEKKSDLIFAIKQDETGQRIDILKKEIGTKEHEKIIREQKFDEYNNLADKIGLASSPREKEFYKNKETATTRKDRIDTHRQHLQDEYYQLRKVIEDNKRDFGDLTAKLMELRRQRNKITGRVAEIRADIARHLGVDIKKIPFIGELIKVRDDQKEWETAIERLLHSFALCLIIPDQYYEDVNRYVNRTNLKGLIVYHRVKKTAMLGNFIAKKDNLVISKLELKESLYEEWLEYRLLTNFDYICVDDITDLNKASKAITRHGLIKNESRHRKDDRPSSVSPDNYVLGWDNKDKIRVLAKKAEELDTVIKESEGKLKDLQVRQSKIEEENENLVKLLTIGQYNLIDWQTLVNEIIAMQDEITELEAANDKIKKLRSELKKVEQNLKTLEKEQKTLLRSEGAIENIIDQHKKLLSEIDHFFTLFEGQKLDKQEIYNNVESKYLDILIDLSFENHNRMLKNVDNKQQNILNQLTKDESDTRVNLEKLMQDFKRPDHEIQEQFPDWLSDTHKLPNYPQYVDEYLALLDQIKRDDLPSYQKKFEDYLSSTMINKIAGFKEYLDEMEEIIEENIFALNDSLKKISFRPNPSTYIQLKCPIKVDIDIKNFKRMLQEAIPDAAQLHLDENTDYKKYIFLQIQNLIQELEQNENFCKKVLDVRNWKSYYAEEFYREDDESMKVYRDMGKLSGGEKAQLTYTILGSAIAYQFGIKHKGLDSNSFRFIAVDESFSNQDDEKAKYLMDLCKQLHLQLLVVTPSDKIHIVEPYISYIHYVQRKNNRESLLFDMPIKHFQKQKEKVLTSEGNS